MTHEEKTAITSKLADLRDSPETSVSLRTYLSHALQRDPVAVLNEIEAVACFMRQKVGLIVDPLD